MSFGHAPAAMLPKAVEQQPRVGLDHRRGRPDGICAYLPDVTPTLRDCEDERLRDGGDVVLSRFVGRGRVRQVDELDDDAEQEDEIDEDDGEADPDPDARGDSTRETCAVAARDAGGVGCEGGSLREERRLEGRLEEPGSGGDRSVLGT